MTAATRYPSPRALLEKYALRAKKSWGQNFLGDDAILSEIARLAAPAPGVLVVELGAGLGHLTARLVARGARVVAVERDRDMAAVLRGELGDEIVLLEADAARLDYAAILRRYGGATASGTATAAAPAAASAAATGTAAVTAAATGTAAATAAGTATAAATDTAAAAATAADAGADADTDAGAADGRAARGAGEKLNVVGNLPYHLTSPILFSLLDQAPRVERAVLLVQREVAERLAAAPGTRDWGILSVLLQREAEVSIERIVPAGAFLPPPKVESAVVCARFRPPADPVVDPDLFRRLVKGGFAQRRKTLGNALRAARLAEPGRLAAALARAGVDPARRAETLTVAEWAALERALA